MDFGSAFALVVLVLAALVGPNSLFIGSVALLNFGALAVLPTSITGGVTLPAASVGMLGTALLTLQRFGTKPFLAAAFNVRRLGLLTGFTVIVVLVTLTAPLLFAGQIYTYPIRSATAFSILAPIGYSSSNVTQAGYLILSWLTAVTVAILADQDGFDRVFRTACLALASLLIVSGVLDMIGANTFLSLFRNASYALVGDTSVASSKRIVGAMPEASAYGATAGAMFSISVLMRDRFAFRPVFLILAGLTGIFTVLSTSSTAYALIVGVGLAFGLQTILRFLFGDRNEQASSVIEAGTACILLMAGLVVLFLSADLLNVVSRLVDEIVFRKALSSSYEERTRWTLAGWDAFFTSGGFGIGAGSARTSNGFINIIASSGLMGGGFFLAFVMRLVLAPPKLCTVTAAFAAPLALFPIFIAMALAGTTPDYGLVAAILFGLQSVDPGADHAA